MVTVKALVHHDSQSPCVVVLVKFVSNQSEVVHVGCPLFRVDRDFGLLVDSPAQSKICQFGPCGSHQNIARFHVTVHVPIQVHVSQSLKNIQHYIDNLFFVERFLFHKQVFQVALCSFHYNVAVVGRAKRVKNQNQIFVFGKLPAQMDFILKFGTLFGRRVFYNRNGFDSDWLLCQCIDAMVNL